MYHCNLSCIEKLKGNHNQQQVNVLEQEQVKEITINLQVNLHVNQLLRAKLQLNLHVNQLLRAKLQVNVVQAKLKFNQG